MWFWFPYTVPKHTIVMWKKYVRHSMVLLRCFCTIWYILWLQYMRYQEQSLVIYIDASLSMMTPDIWGQSRFAIGQSLVSQLSQTLDAKVLYDLYLVGAVPVPIAPSLWANRIQSIISTLEPHRLTLKSWFVWSLLYHTRSYHTAWHNQKTMLVITDGHQTTGSYLLTGNYQSIIVGIGSSGALIADDLWGRKIYTSLDQVWLKQLATQTQSHLFFVQKWSDIDIILDHIRHLIDRWSRHSNLKKIRLSLTLILCMMIGQSVYQTYKSYRISNPLS